MIGDQMISTIETAYRQFLHPRDGIIRSQDPEGTAMFFEVYVRCTNNGFDCMNAFHPEWVKNDSKALKIVITGRHRVYVLTRAELGVNTGEWVNTCNHESEWPSGLAPIRQAALEVLDS